MEQEQNTEDAIEDDVVTNYTFFPPDRELTDRIWALSQAMSRSYRGRKRDRLLEKEKDDIEKFPAPDREEIEKNLQDEAWHTRLFSTLSEVLFHDKNRPVSLQDEEYSSYFQKYVAEKMYNHLAMLMRSPRARKGLHFSLIKEFTKAIAPKLGLDLYLREETDIELREATREALVSLADSFEAWFLHEKFGRIDATFGVVLSPQYCVKYREELDGYPSYLILAADASAYSAEQAANALRSLRSEGAAHAVVS